ncbi:putative transposase [Rhizobium miluonense]|uniref:Putative transposase n=2 Tax=Rhizobium miluonense TaxID=411945 RepID=A0A1C3UD95_9HYPH|nr:putative transposase [Rhizobium miluonense]
MNQLVSPTSGFRRSIPIYYYGQNDRITIDDRRHMTVVTQNTDGTVLEDANGRHERFTREQIYLMTVERRIKVDRDYHSREKSVFALKYGNLKISDFADHKVQKALWDESLIQEYIRFEEIGKKHPVLQVKGFKQRKVSLGTKCLKFLLPVLKSIVVERWSEANSGKELSYKLPSPRHFRRLHDVYIESNCDPLALVSLKTGPKSRTLCHPDDLKLWLEYAHSYADRKRPSMRECYLALEARIEELNEDRSRTGQRLHHRPSRKCFEKLIKEMGAYYLMAKRHGEEYARRKYAIVHGGLMIERPGQIVEMDEWKVNLAVLLTHLRVWNQLSEKEREAVSRARLWLTVAIDRATKCILAMHFSRHAPSSRSSLAALEMVVTDKTLISSVVGAGDPWEYGLKPETISTDVGAAFTSTEFRAAVAALRCTQVFPPSGKPAARGTIESFFRTCELRFMHYFEGRTFANILERGKVDPHGYAAMNLDEFNRVFVRAIIDIYHNTPHWGLGYETPANAWRRLSRDCAIMQPLNPDERCRIFGTELERTITDKGVASTGIHYDHTNLQRLRFEQQAIPGAPAPKVKIRVSRLDLSSVFFKYGNEWVEAKAVIGIPTGTTLFEWVAARKDWLGKNNANTNAKLSTLLAAVRDVRAAGSTAALSAGLGVDKLVAANYDQIEREYFKTAIVDDLDGQVHELVALAIPHNPLEVGVEAFDHIFASENVMSEPETVHMPEDSSAFVAINPDDDGIFFEDL